jgi:predicted thioesterase
MKAGFDPGIVREVRVEVTEDMCPAFDGVVVHRVYSTWSLVHHMEIAARKVLVDYLEDHEEGFGVHISIDHHAPARVGKIVTVQAELTDVRHNRVVCELKAFDGDRMLATGVQVQAVLPKEKIKRILADA